MPSVMRINGKTETVWDDQGFARLLDEKLGSDARDYFLEALTPHDNDGNVTVCSGECDATYSLQEHYESVLMELKQELEALDLQRMTKARISEKHKWLIGKINAEL